MTGSSTLGQSPHSHWPSGGKGVDEPPLWDHPESVNVKGGRPSDRRMGPNILLRDNSSCRYMYRSITPGCSCADCMFDYPWVLLC